MGLFLDFLDVVFDATTELVTGVADDARQLGDELIHISDDSYVSPYQKRADAKAKIERSDVKMSRAKEKFERHYKLVNEKVKKNYELKKNLLGKLDASNLNTIPFKLNINMVSNGVFENKDDYNFGKILGIFGHDIMDHAANQYLEDARDYEVEAKGIIAKIDHRDMQLYEIEKKIDLEEELLQVLSKNYTNKTVAKKTQMASSIRNLMNFAICDSEGNIDQKYVCELENLRTL